MQEAKIRLEIQSSPKHLAPLGTAVRAIAASAGLDERRSFQIELAVIEATTNIMRHALPESEDATIRLDVAVDAGHISFELRDRGSEMPESALEDAGLPVVDIEAGVDGIPEGGMGLGLIKDAVDSVSYERVTDTNVLRMVVDRPT